MMQLGASLLPPGWHTSPSQDTQHEMTRSITTPPWMGHQSNTGFSPAFFLSLPILYSWRGDKMKSFLFKETKQQWRDQPSLEVPTL